MDSRGKAGIALLLAVAACGGAPREPLAPPADPTVARLVIDTRVPEEFAAGHRPGALNIQMKYGQLAKRARSYVADLTTPIAVRATDDAEAEEAAATLRELGYYDVTLPPPGDERVTLPLMSAETLRHRLGSPDPPVVVDVRSQAEWDRGVIEGAILIDHDDGPSVGPRLDPEREYAVICAGGWRSSQLASWMRRQGVENVSNVIDGMSGWKELPGD